MDKTLGILLPSTLMLGLVWISSEDLAPAMAQSAFLAPIAAAVPGILAAVISIIVLFAASVFGTNIRYWAMGILLGAGACLSFLTTAEFLRVLNELQSSAAPSLKETISGASIIGAGVLVLASFPALLAAILGMPVMSGKGLKRLKGGKAVHGDARFMALSQAAKLFPARGSIVLGEQYRVDQDEKADTPFDPENSETWGHGGKRPLLSFNCNFGSTHGLVFAGSGGFKTSSTIAMTALKWPGSMVVLDPSCELAPMVANERRAQGHAVRILDPRTPEIGFNVLDWVGKFGNSKEEDIVSVAFWLMNEKPGISTGSDEFFRGSAEQLLTAMIADVLLSGSTKAHEQNLRTVRAMIAVPEPKLRERMQAIYDNSGSRFVRENIAPFIAMVPQTFSGIYGSVAKETHWLSYDNYAALVCGNYFTTDELADGKTSIFINLDIKALSIHRGLARVMIGSLLNALYNRDGAVKGRTLFLLDETARLGPMRILETSRDAGRKYGITLLLAFQSLGQMREAYGSQDAMSKWMESTSWVSFASVNDPETAEYISRRCGDMTVETIQLSQTSKSGRSRSRNSVRRPLILPHEVLQMRTDDQIIFSTGNRPLRCGRPIFFRRPEITALVGENRFAPKKIGAADSDNQDEQRGAGHLLIEPERSV